MNRHDFVLLFDVHDGNPNGDPDAGNLPRLDPETMHGLVTDGCLKRKVRDYVRLAKLHPDGTTPKGFDIYVKHGGILADLQRKAYEAVGAQPGTIPNEKARDWMCAQFYDVRTFGAVMTVGKVTDGDRMPEKTDDESGRKGKARTEAKAKSEGDGDGDERAGAAKAKPKAKGGKLLWNCGQVRGPVQLTFARSIDPVIPLEHAITRVALTNRDDVKGSEAEEPGGDGEGKARSGQMGRKANLPYGLYRAHGFVSPSFAKESGFGEADLALLWEALVNLFEHDRSAARGFMNTRKLYVFQHNSELGAAPAHTLFDRIRVSRRDATRPARSFQDYDVTVDGGLPAGVDLVERP